MSDTETREADRLTGAERETLYAPGRRMDAYYYSFDPTGVPAIDAILSAVAHAGKGYHNTSDWSDTGDEDFPGRWGAGRSCIDVIQAAANEAAEGAAEVARLRAVVEAVQALADEWEASGKKLAPDDDWGVSIEATLRGDFLQEKATALRAVLAPVSSSGEAESGEGDPAAQRLLRDIFGKHEDDAPAPVSSGGQADGEGVRLIAAAKVLYDDYVSEYSYEPWDTCDREPFMRQAADVLAAADAAARPVLSREALAKVLTDHRYLCRSARGVSPRWEQCSCGDRFTGTEPWRMLAAHQADHLAVVLSGGEQA